jgi:hypothetical protein
LAARKAASTTLALLVASYSSISSFSSKFASTP